MKHGSFHATMALSHLEAALAMAGVRALPHDAVERHKTREAAKYPGTVLWKLFDSRNISSQMTLIVAPLLLIMASGMLTSCLVFALAMSGASLFVAETTLALQVVTVSLAILPYTASLFILSSVSFVLFVIVGMGYFQLSARPPAQWEEYTLERNDWIPPFARERKEAIERIGFIAPAFVVAELRQGEDVLDPVLYVVYGTERIPIAVWDDSNEEVFL